MSMCTGPIVASVEGSVRNPRAISLLLSRGCTTQKDSRRLRATNPTLKSCLGKQRREARIRSSSTPLPARGAVEKNARGPSGMAGPTALARFTHRKSPHAESHFIFRREFGAPNSRHSIARAVPTWVAVNHELLGQGTGPLPLMMMWCEHRPTHRNVQSRRRPSPLDFDHEEQRRHNRAATANEKRNQCKSK